MRRTQRLSTPPTTQLELHASRPCSGCELPGACPVPAFQIQLPLQCLIHVMEKARTWGCIYNVNSWCTYRASTHACWGQDDAPEAANHRALLEYRDLEQRYWQAAHGRKANRSKAMSLAERLSRAKKELFTELGQRSLSVCAFYPVYRQWDHLTVINRTAKDIPMLLTRQAIQIKGQGISV